ncbi:hypothetical protein PVK06_004594 [Gossypium arboreum]|uniref:Photosystem I n=1 Tax=Gossypium arboreum TaxID=29729 RepID=A0ABR0QTP1_GOSAR|nr:hypothetical protein PVK06_004594 [Gossypium arboreum]
MIIRLPEPEVKILVDRDPVKTSFEEWARLGHFSRTIAKGPDTTTWIWNLHAGAHDFDSHTSDLEEISCKIFSAHFGQLSIIFLWLSGMYFHGARFSNYEASLSDPTHIGPSAQVVWPIVGQEILNGDVGGVLPKEQPHFLTLNWLKYAEFLTFRGGLDPVTGGLWLTDITHHHLAIAILFLIAGHMYKTNWGIGHSLKDILEAHKGLFTGQRHKGLYEILTTSWHAQLSLNLAMLGSLTIVVAHHMYSMPPYPYLATDYGFHSFGLYIHNDTMSALGRPQDMFSDIAIQLQLVFAQWIQNTHTLAPGATAPGAPASTSLTWGGGDLVAVGGKVALLPIPLGTADFLVHHIHAFTIHVTVLILLKGVLFARSSHLIPDKANLDFHFPCDGPGRGETCQVSAWDHVFLRLFWMYNSISVVIFHFSWKMESDVWGTISDQGVVTHITGGNFAQSSITINGWLRNFLWAQASQNIFASHFGKLAIIFLWTSGNLFHVAWQGNFEAWVQDPLHVRPIAHAIWDPHFGQPAVEAFTRGGAPGPVNIAYSGVYQWWYTIGLHTNEDLYTGALFLLFLSALSLIAGWLHLQPKWKPSVSWFKNAESRLNHHLSGLFGWNLYAQNPDSSSHLFGTSQGSGTAILTLLGGFHPQTQSLRLTDIAHHHLAIAILFLIASHMYRTNFGIGHSIKDLLEAHIPPG